MLSVLEPIDDLTFCRPILSNMVLHLTTPSQTPDSKSNGDTFCPTTGGVSFANSAHKAGNGSLDGGVQVLSGSFLGYYCDGSSFQHGVWRMPLAIN